MVRKITIEKDRKNLKEGQLKIAKEKWRFGYLRCQILRT